MVTWENVRLNSILLEQKWYMTLAYFKKVSHERTRISKN